MNIGEYMPSRILLSAPHSAVAKNYLLKSNYVVTDVLSVWDKLKTNHYC